MNIPDEVINVFNHKSRIYNLDTADLVLSELVDMFLSSCQPHIALHWADARIHLYECGEFLNVEEKERAVKYAMMKQSALNQKDAAIQMMEEQRNG